MARGASEDKTRKPARESPVQIRWALLARNFGDRMHDSPGSRACCFSSVQCVRTAQSTGALPGAMVPVGPYASQRFPLAVRFSALVWELGQSRQPCSGRTDSKYLRHRFGSLETASGRGRRLMHPLAGEQPELWPQHGEWDVTKAGKYCPRTPDPALLFLPPGSTISPRVRLRPLVSPWKSSHQIRLALSQSGGEGRKSDLGPGHCQLLRQACFLS